MCVSAWLSGLLSSCKAVKLHQDGIRLPREVGHMAKFVRALQLPADKHRRSLPKQIGINLMAAMGVVQQLIAPAAPSQPEQVDSVVPVLGAQCVCRHLAGRQRRHLP